MEEEKQSKPEPAPIKKKNIHAGHRKRMRNRFFQTGLDSFADHEVLELLLFYAVPRWNVNPMAHELVDRFGSFPQVLDAPVAELRTVRGVGPKVAHFLTLIPDILSQLDIRQRSTAPTKLRSTSELAAIIKRRDAPPVPGDTFVIVLNALYDLRAVYSYASFHELSVREVAKRTLTMECKYVALAECTDDPYARLSEERLDMLLTLQQTLAALDIRLTDYYRFNSDCTELSSGAASGVLLPL